MFFRFYLGTECVRFDLVEVASLQTMFFAPFMRKRDNASLPFPRPAIESRKLFLLSR